MELKGPHLTLRLSTMDDLSRFCEFVSDEEVVRHVIQGTKTEEEEKEWLENIIKDPNEIQFTMVLNTNQKIIGGCGIHLNEHLGYTDPHLGIMIGDKKEWGKGYGPEAIDLMAKYVLHEMGHSRVWLTVDTVHKRAIRAYEKVGFVIEEEIPGPERLYTNGVQYVMGKTTSQQ